MRQIISVHTCFSRTEKGHGIFPFRHRRGMTWCSDILGTKSILWLCNKFSQTKHMNSNPKCGIWGRTQRIRGQNGTCYEHKCDKPWSMQPKEIKDMSSSLILNWNQKLPHLPLNLSQSGFYASTVLVGFDHRPATVLKAAFNIFWRLNYASSFLDLDRCKKYSLELYWSPFILLFPLFLRIFL